MSNKIITLGATALATLTLAGVTQATSSFADNKQPQEVVQKEGVQIPDMNLKKALNRALHQEENTAISTEQLAQIKDLDLSYQGISSLEGLQYCTNLEELSIANFKKENSTEAPNTISDLSPLKSLQHLTAVDFRYLPITDVSPLRDLPINWSYYSWTDVFSGIEEAVTNEDDTITLKNPCVGFNGEILKPNDLKGGIYNEKDNTITWSKENFKKNAITTSDHFGEVLLEYNAEGEQDDQQATMLIYVKPDKAVLLPTRIKNSFDFYGLGDARFAQLNYNDDQTVTLKEGGGVHSYFQNTYASILAKDKDGKVLFDKEFKGTDYIQAKEESFDLPEGATLDLYHAEGGSHRFNTTDNQNLKQDPGVAYHYIVKNGELTQLVHAAEEHVNKNLFLNSEFKLSQKEDKFTFSNWSVATVEAGLNGLSSLKDTFMGKVPSHSLGQNIYKFDDGSDLYKVGRKSCDYIGVNEKDHKVTIATSANGVRSTCFSQTVDTKPGQKYHLSLDIEPNKVVNYRGGSTKTTSVFSEKSFLIACQNEDGSHLANFNAHMMKKEGNTYSIDIPAKSNKIKFYVLLGTPNGLRGFYSAQISNLSLTENN
ncbi:putative mucin/carbohydrate-binding domain-containing protein [Lactococcus taiwanensis]|uniref:putative mucin/carbohydrate-binding domain-containing protein n=1 Tax=Lactococcus taiwanensis TaxID=1151742 RepID=UPI0035177787